MVPAASVKHVLIDGERHAIARWPATSPEIPGQSHDLAYLIYTSGSTGKPKGVAIEHRNVVAFIDWASSVFDREQIAGVLAATSVCFDLSIFEIFFPLATGGRIILADNALALATLPARGEVTLLNTVPSAACRARRHAGRSLRG